MKRFLLFLFLQSVAVSALAQTVTVRFGALTDAALGDTVKVIVEARRLSQVRAMEIRLTAPASQFEWVKSTVLAEANGMSLVYDETRGDTLIHVLSHINPAAETTALSTRDILEIKGIRRASGAIPFALIERPVMVVRRDLSLQNVTVGDDVTVALAPEVAHLTPELHPPFPNPFAQETHIGFTYPTSGLAALTVYDVRGRRVYQSDKQVFTAGTTQLPFAPQHLAAGTYFYRLVLTAGDESHTFHGSLVHVK